ncbi:MAG: hypothetical protein L6Q54_02835 [Leptospiraceae bacterium]|nr:transposase [Leptospiraceae bacterium]MCK6380171.1 hypothetical protein [Leptospiraceae bacterium]
MDKFQNKYRIPSARLQHWDYRWAGAYFITICTQHRIHYFGDIENGKMILSNVGVLADVFWYEIKNHAQNVELGAFVVMPNHVHGVLILTGNDVETGHALSPRQQRFQNIGKNSVSSIIGSYKSAVTKHAHRLGFEFEWQTRFRDHIIRDGASFQKISNYIINNPVNWQEVKFFNE